MSDSPHVEDDELPYRHNPIQYLPWLDPRVELEAFQHRAGLAARLAEWCGGEVAYENGLVVRVPAGDGLFVYAQLGDFVLSDGERFWVEPVDGFFLKYWPVGRNPGWSYVCRQSWESP